MKKSIFIAALLIICFSFGCESVSKIPSEGDVKKAYIAELKKRGVNVTKFEKINGEWTMQDIQYRTIANVAGNYEGKECKSEKEHIDMNKTEKGWEIEPRPLGWALCLKESFKGPKFEPVKFSDKKGK
jgi:hypothetical protein